MSKLINHIKQNSLSNDNEFILNIDKSEKSKFERYLEASFQINGKKLEYSVNSKACLKIVMDMDKDDNIINKNYDEFKKLGVYHIVNFAKMWFYITEIENKYKQLIELFEKNVKSEKFENEKYYLKKYGDDYIYRLKDTIDYTVDKLSDKPPIFIDWEDFNIDVIIKNRIGESIDNYKYIYELADTYHDVSTKIIGIYRDSVAEIFHKLYKD